MYEEQLKKRLIALRMQKGVSARDMSLSIGQSESYINKIENTDVLPSMSAFFYICEYFGVTPEEFFAVDCKYPVKLKGLIADLALLDDKQLDSISGLVKELIRCK